MSLPSCASQHFGRLYFWSLLKIKLHVKSCHVGGVVFFSQRVLRQKAAEQSVQRIFGSLRLREAFFSLRVFSALKHFPSPPHPQVTQTVGTPLAKYWGLK